MLSELETFCAVVRCGNMSKAATELHLSQPAVSQRLRSLEEAYGMPLLRRTNRGVELTPGGELLSRYARRMLSLNSSLHEEMSALRDAEPRHVVVGATSVIGGYALPCTVYMFQQKHPAARIQLMIGKRSEIMQRLQDGMLDMAMVEGATAVDPGASLDGWQSQVVSEEELVLITPVEGPLAQIQSFGLEQLKQVPLILRDEGSGSREVIEYEFRRHGTTMRDFNLAMELSSLDAIKTSVAAGHGVSITSKWCVRVEARIGTIRIAPLDGLRFLSRWSLIYPPRGRTMLNRALIRTLRSPAERGFC